MQVTLSGSCFISSHIYSFYKRKVHVIKQKWKIAELFFYSACAFSAEDPVSLKLECVFLLSTAWNQALSYSIYRKVKWFSVFQTLLLFTSEDNSLKNGNWKAKGDSISSSAGTDGKHTPEKEIWCASLNTSLFQHFTPHNSAL